MRIEFNNSVRKVRRHMKLNILAYHAISSKCTFIAFGDWGMDTTDYNISRDKLREFNPNFTVLLGDNFYNSGVRSVSDPLWGLFINLEATAPVFFAVLGNHDYGGSYDAQSAYSFVDPKWNMPARYYSKQLYFEHGIICGIFFDSYFLDKYQLNWLEFILSSKSCQSDNAYRIVFTHYPIHTVGLFVDDDRVAALKREVRPLLEKYRVHAYIAGHEHEFSVFNENGVEYVTSGSFSDKYNDYFANADNPHMQFRDVSSPGFAVFNLNPNNTIYYTLVNSYSGESIFSSAIKLHRNWSSGGVRISSKVFGSSLVPALSGLICLLL